jgi:uncharacterized repeat protein (TIGR03803 family)
MAGGKSMRLTNLFPAPKRSLLILLATLISASSVWAGSKFKVLHNFACGADGCGPNGVLTFDAKGNLCGATQGGGTGVGVVFEFAPQAKGKWNEKVLYKFAGGGDGVGPQGGLVFDSAGDLFGTTSADGGISHGTVFELRPHSKGWTHTVLYEFKLGSGEAVAPNPGLVIGKFGDLYGTAGGGQYVRVQFFT